MARPGSLPPGSLRKVDKRPSESPDEEMPSPVAWGRAMLNASLLRVIVFTLVLVVLAFLALTHR